MAEFPRVGVCGLFAFCILHLEFELVPDFASDSTSRLQLPRRRIRRYSIELVARLLSLGEPIEIIALGAAGMHSRRVERMSESAHPRSNAAGAESGCRAPRRAASRSHSRPRLHRSLLAGVPVVLTIHDVSYEIHRSGSVPARLAPPVLLPAQRNRRARVLTVSAFSASEIASAYASSVRGSRHPLGVHATFGLETRTWRRTCLQMLRRRFSCTSATCTSGAICRCSSMRCAARRHFRRSARCRSWLAGVDRGVSDGLCAMAADAGAPDAVVVLGVVARIASARLPRAHGSRVPVCTRIWLPLIEARPAARRCLPRTKRQSGGARAQACCSILVMSPHG